jgi:hypothetical protein
MKSLRHSSLIRILEFASRSSSVRFSFVRRIASVSQTIHHHLVHAGVACNVIDLLELFDRKLDFLASARE